MGGHTAEENDIIKLTQQLINSIADKDYKEYVWVEESRGWVVLCVEETEMCESV